MPKSVPVGYRIAVSSDPSFATVTEVAGEPISAEQLRKLHLRYCWAQKFCAGKDVVEVACGTGPGLAALAAAGRSLVGGDVDFDLVRRAKTYYGARIPLLVFSANRMPFVDNSKDIVVIAEALYYLQDVEGFVRECRRVLRPGGIVLVITVNPDVWDFHRSEFSRRYYGVPELLELFGSLGFSATVFGSSPVERMALRQRALRPLKRLAVALNLMPRTMAGKRWLKRIVFGAGLEMPREIACGEVELAEPVLIDQAIANTNYQNLHCVAVAQ